MSTENFVNELLEVENVVTPVAVQGAVRSCVSIISWIVTIFSRVFKRCFKIRSSSAVATFTVNSGRSSTVSSCPLHSFFLAQAVRQLSN